MLLSSDIVWEQLNPARGDSSPGAGTVWGDRKGSVATGFFAKFKDGFSSPSHIHNVTYRAVVIKGLIHNDDPNADAMWMPSGSFWTQPAGASHITSAKGVENIAYVEIDQGPYLVKPTTEAFENNGRPVNVDTSEIVWLNSTQTRWVNSRCRATISFLWANKEMRGLFVKLPNGFNGKILSEGSIFHSIVVQGDLSYEFPEGKVTHLDPTSYFGSEGRARHLLTNNSQTPAAIYVRTNSSFRVECTTQ